jgi:lauroyl/myristoyl acyltransferase
MRFVVGDSASEAEIDRLADAHLKRASWLMETRWRPGLVNGQGVDGLENLRAALDEGKGCLLSFTHHGDYVGGFPSIARAGQPVTAIAASGMFDPEEPLWTEQHRRIITSVKGSTAVDVAGGSRVIRELLGQGKAVAIAIDFPGHTPIRFLGHDLQLSSGGTWIAIDMDVPVVVMTARRHPTKSLGSTTVVLSPALHPRNFGSPQELQQELARQLEAAILEWPEALEEPLRLTKRHIVRSQAQPVRPRS